MTIKFLKLKPWQIGGLAGLGWGIIAGFIIINWAIEWMFLTPIWKDGDPIEGLILFPFMILSFFGFDILIFILELPISFILIPLFCLALFILPDPFVESHIKGIFLACHLVGWIIGGIIYGKVIGIIIYSQKPEKK